MANGYDKYLQRIGHTTGNMSKHLPKPNVCRIEVMDGASRRSYMGGFQGTLDCFKETMIDAINRKNHFDMYEPFYGILDNSNSGVGPSIKVDAKWTQPQGNKSGFAKMSSIITGNGGKSGLLGRIPGLSGVNTVANGVFNTVEQVATAGMQLSGVNNNCTGSMTIKDFAGASIEATLPLKFQWYMPEQEDMCRMSLKRLVMMTYVKPMDMDAYDIMNEMINGIFASANNLQPVWDKVKNWSAQQVNNVVNIWGGEGIGTGGNAANATQQSSYKSGTNSNGQNNTSGVADKVIATTKSLVSTGIDAYNSINKYFGGEITANPLPVRVSIGHYLDLEPMVITGLNISASKEQFISADGTHLPMFMNAEVNVAYWMQPGPTKDFLSILGNEVFEDYIDRSAQKKAQSEQKGGTNSSKGRLKRNNNPAKNKKR